MVSSDYNYKYSFLETNDETNKDGVPIVICKSDPITKKESTDIIYRVYGEDSDYYGEIVLKHNNGDKKEEAEIEYYASYEHRNKGNISIALNLVLADAFSNYDLNNIYLNIPPNNSASQRVAEKCGFRKRAGDIRYYDMSKEVFLNNSKHK